MPLPISLLAFGLLVAWFAPVGPPPAYGLPGIVLWDDMPLVDWCFFAWCFDFAAAPVIERAKTHSDTIITFFIDLLPWSQCWVSKHSSAIDVPEMKMTNVHKAAIARAA